MYPELTQYLGPIYFWSFAGIAVLCSLLMLTARHPISGAISLIGVMLSLSGLYAILNSPFIAVLQVLVYAGAIMMLVVFVIMVLNQGKDDVIPRFDRFSVVGLVLPIILGITMVRVSRSTPGLDDPHAVRGGVHEMATQLFDVSSKSQGWYLLFEIGGLLLLAAVVGAVLLAKRSLDSTAHDVNVGHGGHAAGIGAPQAISEDDIAEYDEVVVADAGGHP